MASKTYTKKYRTSDDSQVERKKKPLDFMPVQRKIYIGHNTGVGNAVGLIDAGRILSVSNHRLYRYGKRYEMKIDLDVDAASPGDTVEVWALADSWAVQKAFEEAKDVFDKKYTDERENLSKKARARWFDFRALAGVSGAAMVPVTSDDTNTLTYLNGGEFSTSIVEDQAGTTRVFSWRPTTSAGEYSIPAEYDLSGNTNPSPTTPTGSGPYADLQADASAVEMQAMQNRGDLPPYDANNFPPVWVKIATLETSATEGAQRLSTGYFQAPCGQVILRMSGTLQSFNISNKISCEFKAGDYKGVKAHNMERL